MTKCNVQSEMQFELEVIEYLTKIGGTKQWEYLNEVKTTEQLWKNFKSILEKNNPLQLVNPMSETEFNQVKRIINSIESPYKAGQFLYGVNGISEIEIDLDNGKHVFLTVFDQGQVGGGNTVYQVVNQIQRNKVVDGKPNRRFDVTLLINGLPIIQIELKKATNTVNESFNQMKQYIAEKQYSGIYSTLQILIGMSPYDVKYMANTQLNSFNTAFAFHWQDDNTAQPTRTWKEFSNKVLSIPMAHNLATSYMILDGTKGNENLKVMRPYQVYATKKALDKISKYDFKYDDGRLGYIWHTTGSGKTITSFKTAWLASRLPRVDKVVFLVDRVALTNQTVDAYKAYDPIESFDGKTGVVADTANVSDLEKKLNKKTDKNIIVTSIQKMSRYVTRTDFHKINQNIVFCFDEAHRSAGDGSVDNEGMLNTIRKAIPNAAWIGYTGTPKFPETKENFGELIHAYTIKEAIADKNVLGFNVKFKETIEPPTNPTDDDIDDTIKASVYDRSEKHAALVVEDIMDNWRQRSNNRKYNALFTVHIGGNKSSVGRVLEYYKKFKEKNDKLPEDEKLRIAVSYSMDTTNSDYQLEKNQNLSMIIDEYNELFKTSYDINQIREYSEDLCRRLNKTSDDGLFLDLVIVIDQLLTGFDAPELNTLYIDRSFQGSNLIQAYSRTNRIHNLVDKPWGNIINYRWPVENERKMNEAFAIYSNRDSAFMQDELDLINDGIIAEKFGDVVTKFKTIVSELSILTDNFNNLPDSENKQDEVFYKLRTYNSLISKLKQYTSDDDGNAISAYEKKEEFYKIIGITFDNEIKLTVVLANELKEIRAKQQDIDISQINLNMIQINEININYDFLVELIAKLSDQIKENKYNEANTTKEEIKVEISKIDNERVKSRYRRFVEKLYNKEYIINVKPTPRTVELMDFEIDKMIKITNNDRILQFMKKWGVGDNISLNYISKLIDKHTVKIEDLDKQGALLKILNSAKDVYKEKAVQDISCLSWVKYRIEFRNAFYIMADEIQNDK